MPTLLPFRDYDEHDVINLFAWDGAVPATKGTIVKIKGDGWQAGGNSLGMMHDMQDGWAARYNNTVSSRYNVSAKVELGTSGCKPLGMLLYDVRELDENGEKLIYNPRKAAEMGAVISGQAAPVLTRGVVLYSGATLATANPSVGDYVYPAANGELTSADAWDTSAAGGMIAGETPVGRVLGTKNSNNHILLHLEL